MDYRIFESVLWDIPKEEQGKLEPELYIRRSLVHGNLALMAKTIKFFGIDRVREVFESLKETEFGSRRYNYLKNYFLA